MDGGVPRRGAESRCADILLRVAEWPGNLWVCSCDDSHIPQPFREMNTNRILLVSAVVTVGAMGLALAEESVPSGASFASPDGQHLVNVELVNGTEQLVIQFTGTEQPESSIETGTQVLYVHWALNSKSFVTVEHIVKGSRGRVVYLADKTWADVEVKPPFNGMMHYAVIELKLENSHVHYKFAVETLTPNLKPIDYWFCDVDVSLGTGHIYNVQWTPTSEMTLAASLLENPTYLPPMEARHQ